MKKICFLLLCMTTLISLSAKDAIVVKSGDATLLKQDVKALLECDFSNAKVGDKPFDVYLKSNGEEYVKSWPDDQLKVALYFSTRFNKRNKNKMQVTDDPSAAQYKIVITPTVIDMGDRGSSFNPFASAKAGGAILSGTVNIIEIASNNSVCQLQFEEVKGIGHVSNTVRLGMAFFGLATLMTKM